MIHFLGLWLALSFSSPAFAAPDCSFTPVQLAKAANGFTLRWEMPASAGLSLPFRGADLARYRAWVKSRTKLDARGLIENNLRVGREIKDRLRSGDPFRRQIERDEKNSRLVLNGRAGRIRPMNCLESLPFRVLSQVFDLKNKPLEFQATTWEKNGKLVMIADFYRLGYVGIRESAVARAARRVLQRGRWRQSFHLHNHPFDFKNTYGDIGGTLVPSPADIHLYQSSRPPRAAITNGLDTVVFSPDEYDRLTR